MALVMRDLDLDPKRYPPRVVLRAGLQPQERAGRRGDLRRHASARPADHERMLAEAYTAVPAPAAPGQRPGLRRPDHDDGQHPAGLPRRRRALPPPVPARHGRRVPGHQPRPVPAGPRAGRALRRRAARTAVAARPSWSSSATPTSRSTPSAARRSATSWSSSRTTPTPARSCSSRTTARPRPSCAPPTRSSPQRAPAASPRTCGPTPATATRSSATSPTTSTTRPPSSPSEIDRLGDDRRRAARRRRGLLPHQRPVPGLRGGVRAGRPALQGRRRHAVLRAPRGQGRAGLPAGASPTRPTRSTCAASSTCPSAASATGPRPASRRWPSASGSRSSPRSAGADDAPGIATRSVAAIKGFTTLLEALGHGPRRAAPVSPALLEAVVEQTGYLAELRRPATTPRTRPGSRTSPSWSRSPASSTRSGRDREGVAWRTSSSGSRWWPTPTRSPTGDEAEEAGRRHPDDAAHRQGPGVPGRLPHRHGGRHLPAHAGPGRPQGAGGGAPAGLRRHHPGPRAAVPLPRRGPRPPGARRSTTRRRGSSTRSRPSWSSGGAPRPAAMRPPAHRRPWRPLAAAARRALARQPAGHPARTPATGSPTTASAWARWCASRASGDKAHGPRRLRRRPGVKRLLLRYAPLEKL